MRAEPKRTTIPAHLRDRVIFHYIPMVSRRTWRKPVPRGPRRSLRPRAETMWQPICRHRQGRPAIWLISAARLMSPPCVGTCVIAISLVRRPIARSAARSSACCRRRCDAPTPSICGRRASANIVYIDGSRFLVGAASEDHPPISHPPPIGPLVTAAQHCDITRERIFLHFEKRRPPADVLG